MPCTVNNNTSHDLSQLEDLTKKLVPFAQKQIGFNRPPTINFNDDEKNAANPLGRTAQYDPSNMEIIVFVTGRHTKDILRSIAHELVHHGQNCRGDLSGDIQTELGYAQNNEHMRGMEREAYEVGNLCFRDWEDGIKQQLPLYETIYRESLIGGETMTMKTWRIKELNDLLMEKWGYKPPAKKKLDEDLDAYMDMVDYQTGEERLDEDDDDDSDGDDDDEEESSSDDPPVNPQSPEFRKSTQSEQLNEQFWLLGKNRRQRKRRREAAAAAKKKADLAKKNAWKENRLTIQDKWNEVFPKEFDMRDAQGHALTNKQAIKRIEAELERRRLDAGGKKKTDELPDELDGADLDDVVKSGWWKRCVSKSGYFTCLTIAAVSAGGLAGLGTGLYYQLFEPTKGDEKRAKKWKAMETGGKYPFPEDGPPETEIEDVEDEDIEDIEDVEDVELEVPVDVQTPDKTKPTTTKRKKTRVKVRKTTEPVPAPDPVRRPVPVQPAIKYGYGTTWTDINPITKEKCPTFTFQGKEYPTWTMLVGKHTNPCATALHGNHKEGVWACRSTHMCKPQKHVLKTKLP